MTTIPVPAPMPERAAIEAALASLLGLSPPNEEHLATLRAVAAAVLAAPPAVPVTLPTVDEVLRAPRFQGLSVTEQADLAAIVAAVLAEVKRAVVQQHVTAPASEDATEVPPQDRPDYCHACHGPCRVHPQPVAVGDETPVLCRKCSQPITEQGFGSEATGWVHPFDTCPVGDETPDVEPLADLLVERCVTDGCPGVLMLMSIHSAQMLLDHHPAYLRALVAAADEADVLAKAKAAEEAHRIATTWWCVENGVIFLCTDKGWRTAVWRTADQEGQVLLALLPADKRRDGGAA